MRHLSIMAATAILALTMSPFDARSQTATDTGTTTPSETGGTTATDPDAGAFAKLSPGGQKIATALHAQQPVPAAASTAAVAREPLSLDGIAARKQDGQGWGQVFKGMQAEGLTTEKNLGQAISKSNHAPATAGDGTAATATTTPSTTTVGHRPAPMAAPSKPVVISLADGSTVSVGHGRAAGAGYATAAASGKDGAKARYARGNDGNRTATFVNGAGSSGTTARTNGNGHVYGHGGASSGAGIVSASGASAGAQAANGAAIATANGNAGGNGGGHGNGNAKGHGK